MSLLAIEWLKLRRYKTFWVLILFFMVLLPFWNYQIMNGVIKMGNDQVNILNQAYGFPSVWSNFGWWGSIFVLFLSILVITLTCNEYTFRTHRQNVIDGWSRLNFFHAKAVLVLALSTGTTLFVFIVGALFGISASGSAAGLFGDLSKVGYFFLLVLNYLSAALFVAFWIRRSGLAISLFLLYALIIEFALAQSINYYTSTKLGSFLPLQSSDELLPFPVMSLLGRASSFANYVYVIASVVWIGIYYFAGRRIVLKRDM
jgi:ABC-2 type transport system permease protein